MITQKATPLKDWINAMHDGNKQAENSMLVSALRRLQLRGNLDLVYQPQEDYEHKRSAKHRGWDKV